MLLLGSCGGIVLPRVFGGPPASAPVIGGVPIGTAAPPVVATTATPSPSTSATPAPTSSLAPTPMPTHHPAPTPRPTPTPTPGFTVSAISLCFLDGGGDRIPSTSTLPACTGGTLAPAKCPYRITFTLTPGDGGTLAWSMSGTAWTNCSTSAPVAASGTVALPSPAPVQITITPPPLGVSSGAPNRASAGPSFSSSATVTTPAWPSAAHNVAHFYGTGCG